MKELSIEEKARRYDEALATTRKLYNMRGDWTNLEIESIFPELRKSEDEKIRKFLIQMAQNGHGEDKDWWNKCVAWLEKQGEQKPTEWSEEDERDFNVIYGIIYNSCNAEDASRLIEWLKNLKDRVQPQPQQQWSEEDEAIWAEISDLLWEGYKQSSSKFSWDDIRNWVNPKLKSLKDRYTWKPSDEQIDALKKLVMNTGNQMG